MIPNYVMLISTFQVYKIMQVRYLQMLLIGTIRSFKIFFEMKETYHFKKLTNKLLCMCILINIHVYLKGYFYNMQLLKIGQILDIEYSYVRYLQLILDITTRLVSESE